MDVIPAFRSLPNCFSPLRHPPFSIFTATTTNRRIRIPSSASSTKYPKCPGNPLPLPYSPRAFTFLEASRSSKNKDEEKEERPVLSTERIGRQLLLAVFCFAVGFAPLRPVRGVAIAAPVVSEAVLDKEEVNLKGHEYSKYTKQLLEAVAVLVKNVEEVRGGNGDVKLVEAAWKAVRAKKEELQGEILSGLHGELRELRRDKEALVKRSDEVFDEAVKVKSELDKLAGNAGKEKAKERMERMEGRLRRLEEEYSGVWDKVGEIEDRITRRETAALSFGVRELCFIERECEQLVQSFTRQMRSKGVDRLFIY